MANFTVRVELHKATEADYEELHDAMAVGGFDRTIDSSEASYWLPPAEYSYQSDGEESAQDVCNKAYSIALTIKSAPAVLATKGTRAWKGLKKIT
jgi:hypothetical protein